MTPPKRYRGTCKYLTKPIITQNSQLDKISLIGNI